MMNMCMLTEGQFGAWCKQCVDTRVGETGAANKGTRVGEGVDGMMVVLQTRYKRVAHTGQGNGK